MDLCVCVCMRMNTHVCLWVYAYPCMQMHKLWVDPSYILLSFFDLPFETGCISETGVLSLWLDQQVPSIYSFMSAACR